MTAPRGASVRDRAGWIASWSDRRTAVVLAVLAVGLRLPFRAEFLTNWDSVNFALGIGGFDLATHQPHPPGYLGWVGLSRLATAITSDPNAAMTLLSAIAGGIATALVHQLARRFVDRQAAVIAAVLFATAPLIWYYSVVSLSYMTTGAVALALFLLLVIALQQRSLRHLLLAGVALAIVGALRPTDEALLFPAWAVVTMTFGWRDRIRAAVVMGATSLLWVVPLVWLSGGLSAFTSEGGQVAGLAGGRTWILGGNLAGMGQNLGMVAAGMALALFGGLAVLVVARVLGIRPFGGLPRATQWLLLAWTVPATVVYLLIHTGQLGYVILLLPAAYVGVARALPALPAAVRDRVRTRSPSFGIPRAGIVVTALVAANTLAFLVLPTAGLQVLEFQAAAAARPGHPPHSASLDRTRQYNVAANDAHWQQLTALIEHYDPETTAVVGETTSAGSFRHLSYYADGYDVYGLGWDLTGRLGYLFHAYDRQTTYSVGGLAHAAEALLLPAEVRRVIIPDAALLERLAPPALATTDLLQLEDGTEVAVITSREALAIKVDNPPRHPNTRVNGFPTSTDADETTRRARVHFVPAGAVLNRTPTSQPSGIIP